MLLVQTDNKFLLITFTTTRFFCFPLMRKHSCFYCLDDHGLPMVHKGQFICIPPKYKNEWKKSLEKSLRREIDDDTWESSLKWRNAMVAKGHIAVFDKRNPIFQERIGVPSCFNPESDVFLKREKQREEYDVRGKIKEVEKQEKKVQEWEKKKEELISEGKKLGFLTTINEESLQRIEVKEKEVEEKEIRYRTLEKTSKTLRYTQEIRSLVCRFVSLGVSFRKIPLCVTEVMKIAHPNQKFQVPGLATISQIVREGGLLSKLEALKSLHEMTSPLLGQDSSTSRGRNLLVLSALGTKEEGKTILHVSEVVGKDALTQARSIETMVADLKTLASMFPETASFVTSIDLSKFAGVMSDHASVNAKIVMHLNENEGIELVDLKCSAHKSNLIENSFLHALADDRIEEELSDEPQPAISYSLGMSVPKKNRSSSNAVNVLYTLTKCLSPTGQDSYGFASSFESARILCEEKVKLVPIDGSRFHIYSQNSLSIYPHLPFLRSFLDEYMNHETWTYQFLKKGLCSSQSLSEIRVLSAFSYFFAAPMMYTFRKYLIGKMPCLWQTAETLLIELCENDLDFSKHCTLWNLVKDNELDSNKKVEIQRHSENLCQCLSSVLLDWSVDDSVKFKKCIQKSLSELQKIAKEYLLNGKLANPPFSLCDLPADNLEIESYFGKWKETDTHSRHLSTETLSSMCETEEKTLILSEESMIKLRAILSTTLTQREINMQVAIEKRERKKKDTIQKQQKEERKRKRDEKVQEEIAGVEKVRNIEEIRCMSNTELRRQLLLWKNSGKSVTLSSKRKEKMTQLEQFLEHESTVSQPK